MFLNAVYGAQAKARRGPEGLAIVQANFKATEIAQYFIYAIPIFGIALVFMSDDIIERVTRRWGDYGLPGTGRPIWK